VLLLSPIAQPKPFEVSRALSLAVGVWGGGASGGELNGARLHGSGGVTAAAALTLSARTTPAAVWLTTAGELVGP
jgi:hypothetical protein